MNNLIKSFRPVNTYPSFFDSFFSDGGFVNSKEFDSPAVNISETNDEFKIEFAAPGVKKEDFKINLEGNTLKVSREKAENAEESKEGYTRREFNYSSFERSFHLPKTVKSDAIEATYENGVLFLTLPKKEEAKPQEPRLITVG